MRKAPLAERADPVRAKTDERQAEAMARSVPAKARPPGAGLPPDVASLLRDRLGIEPSEARLRIDPASARGMGADAYTVGNEITFGDGQYAPHTEEGQRLIAHELTHVAQQSARGRETVQRKPSDPKDRLRRAISDLDRTLVEFRARVDDVDEAGVETSGRKVLGGWMAVEAASLGFGSTVQSFDDPTAKLSLPDVETPNALSSDDRALFDAARDRALVAVTIQRYRQDPTVDVLPTSNADVASRLVWQLRQVVDIVRDTKALVSLLSVSDDTKAGQYAVLDLLRKHANPFHIQWMLRVVEAAGLQPKLQALGRSPGWFVSDVYRDLMAAVSESPEADPTAEGALYEIDLLNRKVTLRQPMTLGELAQRLYGSSDLWTIFASYNPGRDLGDQVNDGDGVDRWIYRGTVLTYEPLLNEESRAIDPLLRLAQRRAQSASPLPYIVSSTNGEPAVIGSTVTYTLVVPNLFDRLQVNWEASPGPRWGAWSLIFPPGQETAWDVRAEAPGYQQVEAKLFSRDRSVSYGDASYTQLVVSAEDRLKVGGAVPVPAQKSPQAYLDDLVAQRDRAGAGAQSHLDAEIKSVEASMADAKGFMGRNKLRSVDATYVSTSEENAMFRPRIFAGRDTHLFNFMNPDAHGYILIDYTFGEASVYRASGYGAENGVENLLEEYRRKAPYPKGKIRFDDVYQIDETLRSHDLGDLERRGTLEMPGPTEENGLTASGALRGLSTASLIVGVVAVIFLQPEIAGPAFTAAGALGGAGALASLTERLERGDFEWNMETALDIVDIATAILSAGILDEADATVRGIGKLSLSQKIARGTDLVQLGIVGAVHLADLGKAVASGDPEKILSALGRAIKDGAVILIVHSTARSLKSAPREEGRSFQARRTVSGAFGDEPPPRSPSSAAPESVPSTAHDAWVQNVLESGMAPRPNLAPKPSSVSHAADPALGEYRTPEEARMAYEQTLANTGHQIEVGIFRNTLPGGGYTVRTGSELQVFGPEGREWEGVMHYHPNLGEVRTYRMPAPADVNDAGVSAFFSNNRVTEFVEYPLANGQRGRTAYTVDPVTQKVEIVYEKADGSRVEQTYDSIQDYAKEYSSRTTYVEKGSQHHEWLMEDIRDYYERSWGAETPGPARRTATGLAPGVWRRDPEPDRPGASSKVGFDPEEGVVDDPEHQTSTLTDEGAIEAGLTIRSEDELDETRSPTRTEHIRNVLAADGRPVGLDEDVHHIVLENSHDPAVLRAQKLLEEAHVGIHDAANLVALRSVARTAAQAPVNESFTDHGTIHSPGYFEAVMRDLESVPPSEREGILREIGMRLRDGDYP